MTTKEKIQNIAKDVKKSVETKYQILNETRGYNYAQYTYLFAQTIITPGKDIKNQNIKKPTNPRVKGTVISRTVKKSDYVKLAKNLIAFVKVNKRLPNYLTYKGYTIALQVYIDAFARVVNYYYTHNQLPAYVNINSHALEKPKTEATSGNAVFDYFVKKFGKVSRFDEALEKIQGRTYGYYYDDVYSNITAIDRMYSEAGINCTDSCQVFWHIAKALGYDVECLHVRCAGGDGHVRLKLRHKQYSDNEWFYRDPAAVLDGNSIEHNWCSSGYTLLGTNPSWFTANLNR